MFLSVLVFPLISSLLSGLFGRYLGAKGAGILSVSLIGFSFLSSLFIFYEVGLSGCVITYQFFDWFTVGCLKFSWGFLFDTVTSVMLLVVTSISFFVHLYSTSYMEGDPHIVRFMSYLSLFTFFMLCLVTGDNFVQLFLGWEGVGLSSYLLINFWFTRVQANKAALKALIVNRFGDFAIIMALLVLIYLFKSVNFGVIFAVIDSFDFISIHLVSFFLLIGCIGKSAQLGLHTWLPDAMEGPTPVSALIHAATMVTAGVFLLIRSSILFEYSENVLFFVVIFGALTAFFAGTVGIFQNDLKRVIAYSTCSQLGYMVFACGLSNYSVSMFHLMNHAFFKALLFLSAGSVIHAVFDEQDMRKMGGLVRLLPFTFCSFLIGSFALMGFPFTTGFYSKDVILEVAYSNYYLEGTFAYWLGVLGACCTAFYSFRLIYLTFLGETNYYKKLFIGVHDSNFRMSFPLIILGLGSIFVGYFFKDLFSEITLLEAEFLPNFIKFFPVLLSIIFGLIALVLYHLFPHLFYLGLNNSLYYFGRTIYSFFNKKWYFDSIFVTYLVYPVLHFGYVVSFKLLDRGSFELLGPTGFVRLFNKLSTNVSEIGGGFLFYYVFMMILSFTVIASLGYLILPSILDIFLLFTFIVVYNSIIVIKKK
ncbi:UNVERIFIED_CONTAM: hypothetical protein GTU68_038557 [Idotea baltica]|nr:hypothetical protein [Idotea baltica]